MTALSRRSWGQPELLLETVIFPLLRLLSRCRLPLLQIQHLQEVARYLAAVYQSKNECSEKIRNFDSMIFYLFEKCLDEFVVNHCCC